MSVLVKAGMVTAVLAVGCTGTYFLVVGTNPMPDYSTVANATSYSESTAIGKEYKHILVDTSSESNKLWWEWSYQKWQDEAKKENNDLSDDFKNTDSNKKIEEAFSASNTKALNKVCDAAYGKKSTEQIEFTSETSSTQSKHKLGRDVLRFCSPLGQKPVSIQDSEGYQNTNIGGGSEKANLISVTEKENNYFWEAINKHLQQNGNKPTDEFFKRIGKDTHIKQLCGDAYETTSIETPTTKNPKLDDVKKYCVFSKLTVS